jgi:cell division GTPase FtsZ
MKSNYKLAITLVAGIAIGGAAVQGLHAQAKPPGLVVVDISDITDAEGFKAIGQRSNEAAAAV